MDNLTNIGANPAVTAVTHQLYAALLTAFGRSPAHVEARGDRRDRGAVSLEQVLWFVAAGAMVAIIATILWATIRDKADDPIDTLDPNETQTP